MKEALTKLINLKTILSLVCAGLLIYCTVSGKIDGKEAFTVIVMVFTYFFNKKDDDRDA